MNYWEECIFEALNEEGITATEEQIKNIAGCVEVAHENYGMAFGYDRIDNPMEDEIAKLKKEHQKEIERLEQRELCYRKSVAARHRVSVEDVHLEDGRVVYDIR